MNQELIDRIQQDAVTIQRLTAELDSVKEEKASTASDYNEKLQTEELRYSRLLSETTDKLLGCGKRIDSLESQLETMRKCARTNGWTEDKSLADFINNQNAEIAKRRDESDQISKSLGNSIMLANERALEISRLTGVHAVDLARIDKISALLGVIESHSTECGRNEGETVCAFIDRQESTITGIKADVNKVYGLADTLGRTSSESIPDFMKRQAEEITGLRKRIDRVIADRTPSEALKYQYDLADKLGRGTNERLTDFMTRQNAALDSQTNRTSEIIAQRDLERQELCAESKRKDQTVARLQKVLTKIHDAAKSGGLKQGEKVGAFIERLNEELYKVRCDAASESMKMGNANTRLQQAYDEADEERKVSKRFHALAVEERNNAQEEVSRLSSELDSTTKRLQAGEFTWNTYGQLCNFATSCGMTGDESVKQFIERKIIEASTVTADRDRIRAELAAILAEANKSGRCNGDPVQLLKAGQNDLDALRAMEHEYADQDKYIDKLETQIKDARADIIVTTAQRDSAERRVQELSGTTGLSGDIARLSALVADLQVELDEARGKYSDIVAALENETLQQLIKRTDRSAKEQNASLLAQLASLQKMFRQEMKDHQEAREAMTSAHSAASGCGMRDVESLPAFINRQFGELSEARSGALECGMRPEDNLRSYIYRSRRKLVDAMEAGDRLQKLASENSTKLDAALTTVASQGAAISEAQQVTEKYTAVVEAAAKLKEWASTIRHKVLVAMVHTKAMAEYDTIMKELDGKADSLAEFPASLRLREVPQ